MWAPRRSSSGCPSDVDATQRLYEPRLTADGTVVARLDALAFSRPDLEIDADPATLVAGRVVLDAAPG